MEWVSEWVSEWVTRLWYKPTIIFLLKSSTARQNCNRLTPPFFFRYCKRSCFRLQIVNPIILPIKIRLGIIKMNMTIVKPVGKDKAMLCLWGLLRGPHGALMAWVGLKREQTWCQCRFKGSQLSKNMIIVIDNDDGHSKAILQEDLDKRGCWRCVDDAR